MAVAQLDVLEQLETTEQWSWAGFPVVANRPERTDPVLEGLKSSPYFRKVDPSVLERLAETADVHSYRKNQVLFIEGDTNRILYLILTGLVKVYQLNRDGKERIDDIIGAGELAGAIAFCDGATYPVSAEIYDDAIIALFRWDDFYAIAKDHPDILCVFLRFMANRLRQAQANIHGLALHSATTRLAGRLLDLADAFGKVTQVGIKIGLNLNREELGALVGTSRETATRVLRQFEQEEIVRLDETGVIVLKPSALQALSDD